MLPVVILFHSVCRVVCIFYLTIIIHLNILICRNIKPDQSTTHTIGLSCNDIGSSTQTREVQSTEEHEAHKIMGKNIKEEQNRLKEFQVRNFSFWLQMTLLPKHFSLFVK